MSYDIYIGELVRSKDPEDDDFVVECLDLPDAPLFDGDELTGRGNHRHPGYRQWDEWCREVGLHDLFFNPERGLMRRHPGYALLREEHLAAVDAALDRWKKRHKRLPGWGEGQDPALARLLWLRFWIARALRDCKIPAMENH